MGNLSEYAERIKEYKRQNPDISEEKLIRYVYLDLGQRFSFNLDIYTNRKTRMKIYSNSKSEEDLDKVMESNIVICKSVSYILEYVLKQVGVNIRVVVDPKDTRKCPHMYNIVTPKEGEKYIIDLQDDIENIQFHSYTKRFGLSTEEDKPPVIGRLEIEQMDKELGYIDDENYYADEYLYFLKSQMDCFKDFAEKVQFALENIEFYENKKIKFPERKWRHEAILREIFSKEELHKIHIIECYQEEGENKEYKNCIAVERSRGTDIYMYSVEEGKYCKMTIQDLAKATKNGLILMQGVPGLKKAMKDLKQEDDER